MSMSCAFLLQQRRSIERLKYRFARGERDRADAVRELRREYYRDLWNQAAWGVGAEIEPIAQMLSLRRGDARTFVRESECMLDSHLARAIANNKPLVHKLLYRLPGYRAPRFVEFNLSTLSKAKHFLRNIGGPSVVKPALGTSGGSGVTMNISSQRELTRGALSASLFSQKLLIEEQIPGNTYRLLYLGGQFLHAVRSSPPNVTGNGSASIETLIRVENRSRACHRPIVALDLIRHDLDLSLTLEHAGLSLSYVPKEGEQVRVKSASNQNSAREQTDVTLKVHPSLITLGEQVVCELGLELAGVDILAPTITVPLEESRGVVNEINVSPELHHHHLIEGAHERFSVAPRVLDYLLTRKHRPGVVAARKSQKIRRIVGL